MKIKVLRVLVMSLSFSVSARLYAETCGTPPSTCYGSSTCWTWSSTKNSDNNGNFCGNEGSTGVSITGTVTRNDTGIVTYTVSTCSGGTNECTSHLTNGTKLYGIEIPNLGTIIQPVLTTDVVEKQPIYMIGSAGCPAGSVNGTYVTTQWNPSGTNNDVSKSTQPAMGTFLWNASTPSTAAQAPTLYNLTAMTSLGSSITLTTGTCSSGVVSVGNGTTDTGDRAGTLFFSSYFNAPISLPAMLYRTNANHTFWALPAVSISKGDIPGTYTGFSYDAAATGSADVKSVAIAVNLTATSATATAFGNAETGTSGGTFESTGSSSRTFNIPSGSGTVNGVTYPSTGGVNFPTTGMVSGTLVDGTTTTNISCSMVANITDGRNVMFCVAQSPKSTATPQNMVLAYRRPKPGTVNNSQPFGCPCDANGYYQVWNTSGTNVCQTDSSGSGTACTPGTYSGTVMTSITSASDEGKAITSYVDAVSGLRKIIAVGRANGGQDPFIARYNLDGTLDTTFNTTGYNTANLATSTTDDWFNAVAIDGSNRAVAVGPSDTSKKGFDWVVARYTTGGVLDTTFNTTGYNDYAPSTSSDYLYGVAVDPAGTGQIYVGGMVNGSFAVGRFKSSGAIDTGCAGTGGGSTCWGTASVTGSAYAMLVQGNSSGWNTTPPKILMGGFQGSGTASNFTIVRFNGNLSVDTTFGASGVATVDASNASTTDVISTMAFDNNGNIVAAGTIDGFASSTNLYMARFTSNGALDTTFNSVDQTSYIATTQCAGTPGTNPCVCTGSKPGICTWNNSNGGTLNPQAMWIDSDGTIILTGQTSDLLRAVRWVPNASCSGTACIQLDPRFNPSGSTGTTVAIVGLLYGNTLPGGNTSTNVGSGAVRLGTNRVMWITHTGTSYFSSWKILMAQFWW